MQSIVDWLKTVEQLAHNFYKEASVFFKEEQELSAFLSRLAEDEERHFQLMSKAADYLREKEMPVISSITLSQTSKDHVETPLKQGYRLLLEHTLSKEQMIDYIVEIEFSELNNIFLYAINTMKEHSKAFQHVAAAVQAHEERIKVFLDALPDEFKPARDIGELRTIWENKLLIVEDNEPLRILLSELLSRQGVVETAKNGAEGLEKTREHFFNVIISDVDMPIMNGLEFYEQAIKEDPNIQSHFLFSTGEITPDREVFFKKNRLRYLMKPFSLDKIKHTVDDIIQSSSEKL